MELNADLSDLEGHAHDEEISSMLATEDIYYMEAHFLSRQLPWTRYGWTWSMLYCGQKVQSLTEYILGINHCVFQNVSVQYPKKKHG